MKGDYFHVEFLLVGKYKKGAHGALSMRILLLLLLCCFGRGINPFLSFGAMIVAPNSDYSHFFFIQRFLSISGEDSVEVVAFIMCHSK